MTVTQSATPALPRPSKRELRDRFVGKDLSHLRTPAAIVDVAKVERNCVRMLDLASQWGVPFRAHVKTHKTLEGSIRMLAPRQGLTTSRAIAATMPEAWGLLEESTAVDARDVESMKSALDDVLYSLPAPLDKIQELAEYRTALRKFSKRGDAAQLRFMVDNAAQVQALQAYAAQHSESPFSVFVKVESGNRRAGVHPSSQTLVKLLETIRDHCPLVSVFGFYTHAGNSYGSRSVDEAEVRLTEEIEAADKAGVVAQSVLLSGNATDASRHTQPFVLSVGSTPTAHAAHQFVATKKALASLKGGQVELHAGNYPFLDLQQVATRAVPGEQGTTTCCSDEHPQHRGTAMSNVGFSILSTVIAEYPGRASNEASGVAGDGAWAADGKGRHGDEAMCDAGGIALSRDVGPFGGLGHVVEPRDLRGWEINRTSQEHGLLSLRAGDPHRWASEWTLDGDAAKGDAAKGDAAKDAADAVYPRRLNLGERIRIVPQHSCLTAAQHALYYVVDSRDESGGTVVTDVWVPWKFW
ncbi:unnamed protein product [Parajaminaea phylloscopi]